MKTVTKTITTVSRERSVLERIYFVKEIPPFQME
jgi:hypothetical protein